MPWHYHDTSLVDIASRLIAAGPEGSSAVDRAEITALFEERARSFRVLYEGANRYLPRHRQGKPWMATTAARYEQLASALRAV